MLDSQSQLLTCGRQDTQQGALVSTEPSLRAGIKTQGLSQRHRYCQVYSVLRHLPWVTIKS